jgi:hypothetical protein
MLLSSARSALTLRRALVACVALLCVAVQGASATHLVLTRHAVCPEHGELVHASNAALHASTPLRVAAPPSAEAAVSAVPDAEVSAHADEHCTALASRREHVLLAAPADALIAPPAAVAAAAQPRAVERPAASARYHVAPKQGPPA